MFHLAAYVNAALDTTANKDISALSDDVLTIQNNHFMLPQDFKILGAAAMSATLLRARFSSPKLRQITQPQIRPVIVATLPPNNANVDWYRPNLLTAKAGEELAMQATANPGTTEVFTGLIWLSDHITPLPPGDPVTLRGTSTTAATANAWTTVAYTLDDQIPSGVYAIVGSEVNSTNGQAHRWICDGQYWRPGALSVASAGLRAPDAQYNGRWGEWGRFRNTSLPRLQVLANGADAAHTIYMDVIQISGMY